MNPVPPQRPTEPGPSVPLKEHWEDCPPTTIFPAETPVPRSHQSYDPAFLLDVESRLAAIGAEVGLLLEQEKVLNELENKIDRLEDQVKRVEGLEELRSARKQVVVEIKKKRENIQHLEQTLVGMCNARIGMPGVITHLPVYFSDKRSLVFLKEQLDYAISSTSKHLYEQVVFIRNVTQIVQDHWRAIEENFFPRDMLGGQYEATFKLLGEETHLRSAVPILVSFNIAGKREIKVVYKPRGASTECAIIDLFKKLNDDSCYPNATLPCYKIFSIDSHSSIWEYVEGERMINDACSAAQDDKDPQLKINLECLQSVCQAIGVTDLHHENVLLQREVHRFVPIDMEVIRPGHATGLGEMEGSTVTPSSRAREHIENFNAEQKRRWTRVVPVATVVFQEVLTQRDIGHACEAVFQGLSAEFELSISREKLRELIEQDREFRDAPVFYRHGDDLYYGIVPSHLLMGRGRR